MAKIAAKEVYESGVQFTFTDGEILKIDLSELSEDIVKQLALHGLSQKGGDSYSGVKEVSEARGLLAKVVERLKSGEWKAQRESTGGGKVTDLARALAEVTGWELPDVVAKLDDMPKADKLARRKHPAVAAVLARLAAEKAAAKAEAAEGAELPEGGLL